MSLRINRRNNFLEIKEGSNLKIFKSIPKYLKSEIPDHDFPYHLGYCGETNYGLYSEPSFHHNQDTSFLTSSAVKFNGNEFLETNEISLVDKNNFSISAWVKTSSNLEEVLITDTNYENSGSFQLKSNNENNRPEFSVFDGTGFISVTGNSGINDNDWHFLNVNFSCDQNTKNSSIEIYIDSKLQNSKNITGFIELDNIETSGSFNSQKSQLYKLFDKDHATYIEMSGSQDESDFYFSNPITGGIDKIRYRAINDSAAYGEVKASLILKDKITEEVSIFDFQSFVSSNFDSNKGVSNISTIAKTQTPAPNAIPEYGISYSPVNFLFSTGCPTDCTYFNLQNKTWFPLQEYNIDYNHENTYNRGFYPLRPQDEIDYETDSNGDIIENEPKNIKANFNTWQTYAPFLYGRDWDTTQFLDKEIIGFRYKYSPSTTENATFGMDFSRIIEFGLYLKNSEYNLLETSPLNGFSGLVSNHNKSFNLTIGSTASENKTNFLNGSIDQILLSDKTLTQDEIDSFYSERDSISYSSELADELKLISWYDFSNTNIIGWDRHSKVTTEQLVRLYNFNNTREDSSPYAIKPELFGDLSFSTEVVKFPGYAAFFNGSTYLFDPGGREMDFQSNFTIECFINFSTAPNNKQTILSSKNFQSDSTSMEYYFMNDKMYFDIYQLDNKIITIESEKLNISTNQYYHIAVCRNRNTINLFFNQSLCGVAELPFYVPISDTQNGLYISDGLHGYIQDLRIIQDSALYEPNLYIDDFYKRLDNQFTERHNLYTTSHYPLHESVTMSDSRGIYIPQGHYLETANDHKAFNFHKRSFSICLWFRLENLNKSGFVLGSWNDEGGYSHSYALRYVKNFRNQVNTLVFLASEDGTNFRSVKTAKLENNIISPETWYFTSITYNEDDKSLNMYLYNDTEYIGSTSMKVNSFFTISRRDDFQINGVKHTESSNTFLDLSLSQLFFSHRTFSFIDVQNFWNSGVGITYDENNTNFNRDLIAWFDFSEGSINDVNGNKNLSSSSAFSIVEGRKKLESIDDGSEIFLGKITGGDNLLFNMSGNRPTYKISGINSLPSIEFDKDNLSFLDSNFELDFVSSFTLYFCFQSLGQNNDFAPIIDFSNSESEGLSILWKDTPGQEYLGELKLLVNGEELILKEENFIRNINVVSLEWNVHKEKLFITINNSRLSSSPRVLHKTGLQTNFAKTPLSLGKFYYDFNNELITFNGLLSEVLLNKNYSDPNILEYFSCKYNSIHPGYPVDYIYDDETPSILFDLKELNQTIGEGTTSLGRLKCDLQNPIFSIVDSDDFTINSDGYISLTSPADRETEAYTFTILVEDEDSDLSETVSFISYVQIDNIIAIIDTSNLTKYISSGNKSAGKQLGRVTTTEAVDWSIFSSTDASISITSSGYIELAEDVSEGVSSFSFVISATDYQENITSTTHTVEIVNLDGHTEIEFTPRSNNYIDIETIFLPNSTWIEFESEGESEIFPLPTNNGVFTYLINSNSLRTESSFNTPRTSRYSHPLYDFYDSDNLSYRSALNPITSTNSEHSYLDSETLSANSSNPQSYDQYVSGYINAFEESDNPSYYYDNPTELRIHLTNNKFDSEQPNSSTYFESSIIENTELAACKKVLDNLKYIADSNPYSVDPPDFSIANNTHRIFRIYTSSNQNNKPCKIRLKTVSLSIKSSNSSTPPDIKIKADQDSFLQHLSFGYTSDSPTQSFINKLTLDCETDQLISLRSFFNNLGACNEIEKINFNTKNVITLHDAFANIIRNDAINDNIKNFLSSLSFENLITAEKCFRMSHFTGTSDLNLSNWNTWNLQIIDKMFEDSKFYQCQLKFLSEDINTITPPRHYGSSNDFDDVEPDSYLPNNSYITYFNGIMNSTFYTKKIRSARECFRNIIISSQTLTTTDVHQPTRHITIDNTPTKNKNGTDYLVATRTPELYSRYAATVLNQINYEYEELGNLDCFLNTELNLNCFELDLCCASKNMFYASNVEKIKIRNLNFTRKFDLSYFFYNSEFLRFVEFPEATPIKPTESLAYSTRSMFQDCLFLENLGIQTFAGQYAQFENHKSFIDGFSFFNLDHCVDASSTFQNCYVITNISIPRFTNIINLAQFAQNCRSLSKVEGFSTHAENNPKIIYLAKKADGELDGMNEAEEMDWIIENNLHLQTCNTKNLRSLSLAFNNCERIRKLVFSGLSTNKAKNLSKAFSNCRTLREIRIGLEYHTNNYRNGVIATDRHNIQEYWDNAAVPAESIDFGASFGSSGKGNVKINGKGNVYAESIGGAGVKVFEYDAALDQWNQRGETINAPSNSYNKFGHAIEIDENGERIIVSDFPDSGSTGSGYVQIFEWSGGSWGQLGDTIVSEESSNDTFGADVSISKDGNIVAISTEGDPLTRNASHQVEFQVLTFANQPGGFLTLYLSETYSSYTTFVIEFSAPETDPTITQNDTTLTLNFPYNNYGVYYPYIIDIINWLNLQPGISAEASSAVNLNNSGLEQSESGQTAYISPITLTKGTKIFSLEDSNWVQLGETISAGQSINLNNNGSIISIGDPEYNTDSANNVGKVEVFEFDSSTWIKLGSTITGPDTSPVLTKTVANIATTDGGASEDPARVIELDLTEEYLNVENFSLNFYQNASEAVLSNGGLDLAINVDFSAADVSEDFFFTIPVQRRESGPQWWGPNYVYQRGGTITVSGAGLNVNTTFTLTFTAAGTPATFDHDIDNNTVTLTYPRFSSNQTFRVWTTGGGSTYLSMGKDPSVISLVNFINNQSGFSATTTAATSFENRSPPGTLQGTYNSTYSGEGQGPYVEQFVNWINNSVENISARITVPYDSETNSGIELDQFLRPQDRSDIVKSYTDADDNRFGYNDINFNGNRVIVGATHSNTEVGEDSGLVKIFDYNGTEWTQVGTTINGHESLAKEGLVSINKVGNIIITGGINKRNFRIFKEINSEWIEQHSESHIISSTKEVSIDMDYSGDNTISIQSSDAVVRTRKEREIQIYNVNGFFDTRECRDFSSMFQNCLMLNHFGGKLLPTPELSSSNDVFGIIDDKIFDSLAFNYKSAVNLEQMFSSVFSDYLSNFISDVKAMQQNFRIFGSSTYYVEIRQMFEVETTQEIEELMSIYFDLDDPLDLPAINTATSLFYSSLGVESLGSPKRLYSAINAGQANDIIAWSKNSSSSTIPDESIDTALSVLQSEAFDVIPEHKSFFFNFYDREIDSEISLKSVFIMNENIESVRFLKNPNFKNKINNISNSFNICRRLRDFIDLRGFNLKSVESADSVFRDCYHIKNIYFDDTFLSEDNATIDISFMFYNCYFLQSINSSNWIGDKLYTMRYVFSNCHSIESINLSKLNPENCLSFAQAFYECNSINELNLNNFSTKLGIDFSQMFEGVGGAYPVWEFIYEPYGPEGSSGTVSNRQPDHLYRHARGIYTYFMNNYIRDNSNNIIPPSSDFTLNVYQDITYLSWYSLFFGSFATYDMSQPYESPSAYLYFDFLRDNFFTEAQSTMPTQAEYDAYINGKWDNSEGLDSIDLTSFDISNACETSHYNYSSYSMTPAINTTYREFFGDKYLPRLSVSSSVMQQPPTTNIALSPFFLKAKESANLYYFEKINESDHPLDYTDRLFNEFEKAYEGDEEIYSRNFNFLADPYSQLFFSFRGRLRGGVSDMFNNLSINTLTIPENFKISNHSKKFINSNLVGSSVGFIKQLMQNASSKLFYTQDEILNFMNDPNYEDIQNIGTSNNPNPLYGSFEIALSPSCDNLFEDLRANELNISDNFLESLSATRDITNLFNSASSRNINEHWSYEEYSPGQILGGAIKTNSTNFSKLNTSSVVFFHRAFSKAMLENLDLSTLNTSKGLDLSYMFNYWDLSLNPLVLSNMDTSSARTMSYMFSEIKDHSSQTAIPSALDLSSLSFKNVTNIQGIFENTNINIVTIPTYSNLFKTSSDTNLINISNAFRQTTEGVSPSESVHHNNIKEKIDKINSLIANLSKGDTSDLFFVSGLFYSAFPSLGSTVSFIYGRLTSLNENQSDYNTAVNPNYASRDDFLSQEYSHRYTTNGNFFYNDNLEDLSNQDYILDISPLNMGGFRKSTYSTIDWRYMFYFISVKGIKGINDINFDIRNVQGFANYQLSNMFYGFRTYHEEATRVYNNTANATNGPIATIGSFNTALLHTIDLSDWCTEGTSRPSRFSFANQTTLEHEITKDNVSYIMFKEPDWGINCDLNLEYTISNITPGSRVQVFNLTRYYELYNDIVNSTSLVDNFVSSEIQEGDLLRIRVSFNNGSSAELPQEKIVELSYPGLNIAMNPESSSVYTEIGVDGSAVNEFSLNKVRNSPPAYQIKIDDSNDETFVERFIAWYLSEVTTEIGIHVLFGAYEIINKNQAKLNTDYNYNVEITFSTVSDLSPAIKLNNVNSNILYFRDGIINTSDGSSIKSEIVENGFGDGSSPSNEIIFDDIVLDLSTVDASYGGTDIEFVLIETGSFEANMTTGCIDCLGSEETQEVFITEEFYLAKTEVTQAQYELIARNNSINLATNPSTFTGPNLPVETVSWFDTEKFIGIMNTEFTGLIPVGWSFSLPSEAEWEFAGRAGSTGYYHWGNSISSSDANYNWDEGQNDGADENQTVDVTGYSPNNSGIYDIHGNVSEWVLDSAQEQYPGESTIDPVIVAEEYPPNSVVNPFSFASDVEKIIRGGAWNSESDKLKFGYRSKAESIAKSRAVGFRLAIRKTPLVQFNRDTFILVTFDSSGSMSGAEPEILAALSGGYFKSGSTTERNPESLRAILQDFYATAGTEFSGNTNPATNGRDEYDKKVKFLANGSERHWEYIRNAYGTGGLGVGTGDDFEGAKAIISLAFQDESSPYSNNPTNTQSQADITQLKADVSALPAGVLFFAHSFHVTGTPAFKSYLQGIESGVAGLSSNFTLETEPWSQMFGFSYDLDENESTLYFRNKMLDAIESKGYKLPSVF
jgi:formylglycine-generating enzyme required for sulfatase activity